MSHPSLVNRGEFFSAHYLDALLAHDLGGLRESWKAVEDAGDPTPRTRLRRLASPFFAAKAAAVDGDTDALRAVHDAVLGALGFPPERATLERTRGDTAELTVPVAHAADGHDGGLLLVALEAAGWADDVDAAQDPDGAGRLAQPLVVDGEAVAEATAAIGVLFTSDDPPRYVLWLAGGVLLLADRAKWSEGRFLAVNLDLALEARDTKAKGELETIAALFSADALLPAEEGHSVLDELITASHRHAVAVSDELREGVRRSVEILANEVITQRLATHQVVYADPDLPRQLTRQCLRFLYRLLFLLYAEARPELGILPVDDPEYQEGYGLDRLRDLALADLHSEKARNGHHLHASLDLLFGLVNSGHHHDATQQQLTTTGDGEQSAGVGIVFEPLHSELFSPDATPLIDSVRLRNAAVQRVLELLLLSKEQKGVGRGFVSYAQLGINQLGAVYEGLMAYSGFLADEDLYEVRRPGAKESGGTWALPVSDAEGYPDEVFVAETDERTGQPRRVRHPKGAFVFRLASRDRQRSASYYTPEVLTSCVVRHALAELVDDDQPAADLLDVTICEPALGSGAFLNEAITQLAETYLDRRQRELGETLDPDRYAVELQRVKTHFALHQSYGVDLNDTAVELAEVSLWLNAMHQGLRAPWFGLHLRRGNSLVGASRAAYLRDQLAKRRWLTEPPHDRPLSSASVGSDEIHHFLLPAAGWGAVADAKQAKELRPEAAGELRQWRKSITKALTDRETRRLAALARRVEALWELATQRLVQAERDLRRPLPLYGQPPPEQSVGAGRQRLAALLADDSSPLGRLRLVMDAWCALWFWPVDGADGPPNPPTREQWLDALEGLLGTADVEPGTGQLDLLDLVDRTEHLNDELRLAFGMRTTDAVIADYPWLQITREITQREGFFHWELEFAPVFARGGFELTVGNPPWVRLSWNEDDTLAECDPWFATQQHPDEEDKEWRRHGLLQRTDLATWYLNELTSLEGLAGTIFHPSRRPILQGLQKNLYLSFIASSWTLAKFSGVIGLLHPTAHLTDNKGAQFRAQCYFRLRRYWQFTNEAKLFTDIGNTRPFGVHVYARSHDIEFMGAWNLQLPETLELSLVHDGQGEVPGVKGPSGKWDRRPHADRIINVNASTLTAWAGVLDEPGTPPEHARLGRLHSKHDARILQAFATVPRRLRSLSPAWSYGVPESSNGQQTLVRRTHRPEAFKDAVLQGPHVWVANPFAQEPNPGCRNHRDYSKIALDTLGTDFIPMINYARRVDDDLLTRLYGDSQGRLLRNEWRLMARKMIGSAMVRSLHAAIMPPGPVHLNSIVALAFRGKRDLAIASGVLASLVCDHFIRISGKANLGEDSVQLLPLPSPDHPLEEAVVLRSLRLNCLTSSYSELWEPLFQKCWQEDHFTSNDHRLAVLGQVPSLWDDGVPLRLDLDRYQAALELDVAVGLMLGLDVDDLCTLYRTQFDVLRKYDSEDTYDADGWLLPRTLGNQWRRDPDRTDTPGFRPPFDQRDREKDMRVAYETFQRRLQAAS